MSFDKFIEQNLKKIGLFLFLVCEAAFSFGSQPLLDAFIQAGYVEIGHQKRETERFDALYASFDECVAFFQKNRAWVNKLRMAKERFIRSKAKKYYSTDFFGLYDESERVGRSQISFYYSTHFHEFIFSFYPEFFLIPEISSFFDHCLEMQKPYGDLFEQAAFELGAEKIFDSEYGNPPILFKVVKYLPDYVATKPHYDGSALTLFLDSTDNGSLFLSSYKTSLAVSDFFSPSREFSERGSILLIPGALLSEFSIYPTPHIVLQSGKVRYAAIAFAMRPNYTAAKNEWAVLPNFE